MKQACNNCRFWSALAVEQVGFHEEESTCLNAKSADSGDITQGLDVCELWAGGDLGSIDDPCWGVEDARAAYAKFDGDAL